jgi:hypothetical protein
VTAGEDGSMGLILLIEVQPVVESSWFPREANRVLGSDGVIVGVSWNRASLRGLMWRALGQQKNLKPEDDEGYYGTPYLSQKQRFLDAGFSFIHELGFCWSPFSRRSDSPLIPPCVALERLSGLRRVVRWSPWVVFIARKSCMR